MLLEQVFFPFKRHIHLQQHGEENMHTSCFNVLKNIDAKK